MPAWRRPEVGGSSGEKPSTPADGVDGTGLRFKVLLEWEGHKAAMTGSIGRFLRSFDLYMAVSVFMVKQTEGLFLEELRVEGGS